MEQIRLTIVGKIDLPEKPVKKLVVSYPQEEIHFFKARNNKVVGRSNCGKIAIISFNYKGQWVNDGDTWLCNIIRDDENKIIVWPVYMTISAQETFEQTKLALESLKKSGFKKEFTYPEGTRLYTQSK